MARQLPKLATVTMNAVHLRVVQIAATYASAFTVLHRAMKSTADLWQGVICTDLCS